MDRSINIVAITDPNNAESRTLFARVQENLGSNIFDIPIQRVQHILPGIRATPAVGVLLWATDLQGLAADVGAFADYIRDEAANKQALTDAVDIAQAYVDLAAQNAARELGLEVTL